jgi:hypothetical protein
MLRFMGVALLFSSSPTKAALPKIPLEPHKAEVWRERRVAEIADFKEKPKEDALLGLGKMARQLGVLNYRECQEKDDIIRMVRSSIISIPGHAEFFATKIRADDILRETGRGQEVQGGVLWDFETLGQLPSPETVKVLGSFLDDERHRVEFDPNSDVAPIAANSLLAARALHSLKIASPPLYKRPGTYDDIQPWRLWFAQVKAGKRTFRFEGDPQHYSLAGPVAEAREPQRREAKAPAVAAGKENADGAKPKGYPTAALVLTLAALAAAIGIAFRRKAAAESR